MLKNLLLILAVLSMIAISNNFAFAQKRGSWADVRNLVNQEVAVKARGGKTIYGILMSADDNAIQIRVAGKRTVSTNITSLSRRETERVWHARLFLNKRKTGTGALIGALIGSVGMGGIAVSTAEGDDRALAPVGFILGAIPGALVGGAVGFFAKKKHERGVLVFES